MRGHLRSLPGYALRLESALRMNRGSCDSSDALEPHVGSCLSSRIALRAELSSDLHCQIVMPAELMDDGDRRYANGETAQEVRPMRGSQRWDAGAA